MCKCAIQVPLLFVFKFTLFMMLILIYMKIVHTDARIATVFSFLLELVNHVLKQLLYSNIMGIRNIVTQGGMIYNFVKDYIT